MPDIGISGSTTGYSMFYLCGNGYASGKEEFERFLVDGETYTISLNGKNNIVLFGIIGEVHNKDGSLAYYINSTDKHTFTVDKSKYDYYYLRIFVDKDYIEFSNSIIYPQLELGTVSTEYVPYVEPKTYTANENGMLTVESIYPSMTITAETNTKNLLTSKVIGKPSGWYESNGVYESFGNHYAPLTLEGSYLEAGKEYVISIKVISFTLNRNPEPYHSYCACLNYTDSNGKKYESDKIQMDAKGVLSISFTPTVSAKYNLFVFGRDSSEGSVAFSNPKVTLAGAKIECEYNRDINKAFAELRQAIISLGGNL
ncbi:MAG: hypothetical protein IIX60_01740 [Clostridia bacterium]|nr:hypothetical protein [Clostridia bacterium]